MIDSKLIGPRIACEGVYKGHLQGVATNGSYAIFWSWSDAIVKTGLDGKIIQKVSAPYHQGDLCFYDGKVYVAVNLGKFNEEEGQADSWIFVYDDNSLKEVARHKVKELVHGAGGIAFYNNKFIVVGGLPAGHERNYLYEYDINFNFKKRHLVQSGYTYKGIQTAAFINGDLWFGCYGKPHIVIRTDKQFKNIRQYEFDASLGFIGLTDGNFLVGQNEFTEGEGYRGSLVMVEYGKEGSFKVVDGLKKQ
ncbi:MAG: hypothetical protein M3512_04510 [Bacteroidota bacterium]|nr:hypothetical protein [Bacteroidota bacterium]